MALNAFDWGFLAVYVFLLLSFSYYLGKTQESGADYYVGGRKLGWFSMGMSILATQSSAVSAVGIPGFVGVRPDGGLTWLQFELGVPLAMIFVMEVLAPFYISMKLVSVYEYLGSRFDDSVRLLMSGIFIFYRALATGITLYAGSLVLSVITDLDSGYNIVLTGVITVVYDWFGGMTAVVYGDVIQMFMLVIGTVVAFFVAAKQAGGVNEIFEEFPLERASALDFQWGASEGQRSTSFWAFNFGSIILWTHYYGTEQQPAQRILCAKDLDNARGALLFNGLARFPLTALYALLGIALRGLAQVDDEYLAAVCDPVSVDSPSRFENCDADELFPQFIKLRIGDGTRGLLCAALLSAALSSLNSALNSLSAAVSRDFVEGSRWFNTKMREIDNDAVANEQSQDAVNLKKQKFILYLNKFVTFIMAIIVTGFAFILPGISETVSESANLIGSAFYGSMFAVYALGIFDTEVDGFSVWVGVIVGVGTNLILFAIYQDDNLFWMWWNCIGFILTYGVGMAMTYVPFVRQPTEAAWNAISKCCFSDHGNVEGSSATDDLLQKDGSDVGGKLSAAAESQQQFELSYASVKGTDWARWWPAYTVLAGYYGFIFVTLLVITLQYSDGIHF